MVRVPGRDLLGAVDLFQEHCPGEAVRPGHRAERDHPIGAREDPFAQSFGAADRKGERALAAVAPILSRTISGGLLLE